MRIILVETEPKIMTGLHTKLGAYVMKQLMQMGIEIRLKSRVTQISQDHIELNSREIVPTNTVIWVAGMAASPCIDQLKVEKDSMGRIHVTEYLEIPAFPECML